MSWPRKFFFFSMAFWLVFSLGQAEQPKISSPVLQAMKDELTRCFKALQTESTPAYFLSYEIIETNSVNVSGSFGTVVMSSANRRRLLDIDLRVGDYSLDNTHPVRGGLPALPIVILLSKFQSRTIQRPFRV